VIGVQAVFKLCNILDGKAERVWVWLWG